MIINTTKERVPVKSHRFEYGGKQYSSGDIVVGVDGISYCLRSRGRLPSAVAALNGVTYTTPTTVKNKIEKVYTYSGRKVEDIPKDTLRGLVISHLSAAIRESTNPIKRIFSVFRTERAKVSYKMKSELYSHNVGEYVADYFNNHPELNVSAKAAVSDRDPDITFTSSKFPGEIYVLEIKVTRGKSWRGGEYSKRDCDYVMLAWCDDNNRFNVYAAHVPLVSSDWMPGVQGKYYAPSFPLKYLDRNDRIDIIGNISGFRKTGSKKETGLNYENI
jgi:hypothetical protein